VNISATLENSSSVNATVHQQIYVSTTMDNSFSFRDSVLADKPRLFYRFAETGGSVPSDSSPFNTYGTHVNSPTLGIPGFVDNENSFGIHYPVGSYTIVSGTSNIDFDKFSIEFWYTPDSTTQTGTVISRGDWRIQQIGNKLQFQSASYSGSLSTILPGINHHLTVSTSGVNNQGDLVIGSGIGFSMYELSMYAYPLSSDRSNEHAIAASGLNATKATLIPETFINTVIQNESNMLAFINLNKDVVNTIENESSMSGKLRISTPLVTFLQIDGVTITDDGRTFNSNLVDKIVDVENSAGENDRWVEAHKKKFSFKWDKLPSQDNKTSDKCGARDTLFAIIEREKDHLIAIRNQTDMSAFTYYNVLVDSYSEEIVIRDTTVGSILYNVTLELIEC
jgi:hypothetical protein